MTDKFSIRRMGCLMQKYLNENKKSLILKILVMYGVLIVVTLFAGWNSLYFYRKSISDIDETWIRFFPILAMLVFAFGCLAGSVMFEDLRSKESRASLFMTPATTLEKYLSRWILYILIFPILFAVGFYMADALRCLIFRILVPDSTSIALFDFRVFFESTRFPEEINPAVLLGLMFLSIQSFFVLGSVVWQPISVVKTFGALFVLSSIYLLSTIWLVDTLSEPGMNYGLPKTIDNVRFVFNGFDGLMLLACLINWTLAYFRLKESEIIKRW